MAGSQSSCPLHTRSLSKPPAFASVGASSTRVRPANERPLPVRLTESPRPGWHVVESGAVGEFTTFQMLDATLPAADARAAATGWGGDRYELWARGPVIRCHTLAGCRNRYLLLIGWRWDTPAGRKRFERALRRYAGTVGAHVRDRDGTVLLVAGDPAAYRASTSIQSQRRPQRWRAPAGSK